MYLIAWMEYKLWCKRTGFSVGDYADFLLYVDERGKQPGYWVD